jgi:replicative DNA helicase
MTADARVPPASLDAERAVLGAVLLRNETWRDVVTVVTAEDFYRGAHQVLWRAMAALAADQSPIDPLTLSGALGPANLDAVGGVAYITRLTDGVPQSTRAATYAGIVAEHAQRRRLIAHVDALREMAWDADADGGAVLVQAQEALVSLSQSLSRDAFLGGDGVLVRAMDTIEALNEGRVGLATGYRILDRWMGGYQPGQLIIVGARPGVGKSAFVTSALLQWLPRRLHVGIVSLEMTVDEVGMRWLSASASVDMMRARTQQLHEHERYRLGVTASDLSAVARYLHVTDTPTLSLSKIRAMARRCQVEHGLDVLVIDYLQLLDGESRKGANRYEEVSAFSRGLKLLAKTLGVPILCLAQLNRQTEGRANKRPQLSDLRDSGAIEQDADIVLFLHREDLYAPTPDNAGRADLIIAKGRNVPLGTLPLRYRGEFTRFEEEA